MIMDREPYLDSINIIYKIKNLDDINMCLNSFYISLDFE